MMLFLKKAWALLRAYWYVPVALISVVLALVFKKKDIVDWAKVIDDARNSHKKEIDAIEKAHQDEITARNVAIKRMEIARKQIQEEFDRNKRDLDATKQKEIERIIKKTKDDPQAMAKELEESTGYRILIIDT